jgi:transcriptional regulator with XRE-family HTH domain
MPTESFSDRIRKLIDSSGVSRYRIAIETGIDHAVLSRFMNGKGGLSISSLDALADYLGWQVTTNVK